MSAQIIVGFPLCPHCGQHDVAFYVRAFHPVQLLELYSVFLECGHCHRSVCAEVPLTTDPSRGFEFKKILSIYPKPMPTEAPEHTPEDMARAYKTALRNFRFGDDADYEAASIMARRCIDLAVNAAGGKGQNLYARIEDLANRQILTPTLKDWAHEIRSIGNDGAHNGAVSRDDAGQAVYFAEMLLTYLYTLPGMIVARRIAAS